MFAISKKSISASIVCRRSILVLQSLRYSSSNPSWEELHARFKPISDTISKLQLHLETNPQKLDEYVKQGLISQHTADFFKKENTQKEKAKGTTLHVLLIHFIIVIENALKQGRIFYYIGIPAIILTYYNAHLLEKEEHLAHSDHPTEYVDYPYLHRLTTVSEIRYPDALFIIYCLLEISIW